MQVTQSWFVAKAAIALGPIIGFGTADMIRWLLRRVASRRTRPRADTARSASHLGELALRGPSRFVGAQAEGGWSSVTLVERYAHLLPAGHEEAICLFLQVGNRQTSVAADAAAARA